MKTTSELKINLLMTYVIASTLLISFLTLNSFKSKGSVEKFDEIEVKKITVLGENNLPRMVLSNETRQHSGRANGTEMEKRQRPSGLIFFNNEGDECGGLVYQSKIKDGKIISGMSFTMDNYNDDQVVQVLNDEYYADGKSYIQRGIKINQYPSGTSMVERNNKIAEINKIVDKDERNKKMNELLVKEDAVNRLFIGRTKGNSSGLFLSGPDGKPKMMIYVDEKGNPKITTINDKGEAKEFIEN